MEEATVMNKNICISCGESGKYINNLHNEIEYKLCNFCKDFATDIILEGLK